MQAPLLAHMWPPCRPLWDGALRWSLTVSHDTFQSILPPAISSLGSHQISRRRRAYRQAADAGTRAVSEEEGTTGQCKESCVGVAG